MASAATADRRIPDATGRRERLVVILALVSGATDAIGFLRLGGAFSSVMTGNMVLLGLAGGTRDAALAVHAAAAIAAFVAGCVVGARVAGVAAPGDPLWPPAVTRALRVELGVLLVYAVGFEAARGRPVDGFLPTSLLALNAVALGIQSSAIQRFGVAGLSTTYLTGTLTATVIRLAAGRPLRDVAHSLQLLTGLIVGAAVGGAVGLQAPRLAPLLQLAGLAAAIAGAPRPPASSRYWWSRNSPPNPGVRSSLIAASGDVRST